MWLSREFGRIMSRRLFYKQISKQFASWLAIKLIYHIISIGRDMKYVTV